MMEGGVPLDCKKCKRVRISCMQYASVCAHHITHMLQLHGIATCEEMSILPHLSFQWVKKRRTKAVLDYGSGSGVLAICAAHLGASTVVGVDVDEGSVDTCQGGGNSYEHRYLMVFGCFWMFLVVQVSDTCISVFGCVVSNVSWGDTCSQFTSCLHAEEWGFLNCSSFHSKLQPNQSIKCSREIQRALAFVLRFLRCDSCQKNKRTQQDRQESTTNEIAKRNSVDICGPIPSTYWHVGFQYVVICGICTCLYCIFGQGVCKAKLRIKPCREQHSSVPSQS